MLKITSSPFACRLLSCVSEFTEAKNLLLHSAGLTLVNFLYSGVLCNKNNFIVKRFDTLISRSPFCYTAESDKSRGKTGH